MEIIASDLAKVCNVTPQNIYMMVKDHKLVKTESNKYNIHEPLNLAYLKSHGKSVIDVQEFIKNKPEKPKSYKKLAIERKRKAMSEKVGKPSNNTDQSSLLVEAVDYAITSRYTVDEADIVKGIIFERFQELIGGVV